MMSEPTLDPSLLQAFVAVSDQRSFTSAARRLNRTQSAVSSQIRRLEEQLGLRLFERTTTRVELSPAGEKFLGYAQRILALNQSAIQHLRKHETSGAVRLGVMDDYGTIILPALLKSFSASYPLVEIQMETGLTSSMLDRIGSHYDLVIAMHPAGETLGHLLCQERALWAGSPLFEFDRADPLPVALYPPGCLFRRWAKEALRRAGRPWRLAYVSHSLSAVEAIAAQGLAITVVKEGTMPSSLSPLGQAEGLPELPSAEIRLHTAEDLSPASRLLADHLMEFWKRPRR